VRIDADDWEEWLAHPLTEAVMRVCKVAAGRSREEWTAMSFDRGSCDPLELVKMRARAAAFEEITNLTPQKIEEVLE
jgi:hypothetical protein